MNYLFSAKNNAFYPLVLKDSYVTAGTWPDDGKEVGEDVFNEFVALPPAGKYRGADKDGFPAWLDVPPPTKEQQLANVTAEQQNLIQDANAFINNKQWPSRLTLGRLSDADKSRFNKWLDYIDALTALDLSKAPDIAWPQKPE